MNEADHHLRFLRDMTSDKLLLIAAVLVGCWLLVLLVRWIVRLAAEGAAPHRRLLIWRLAPIARLLIWISGIAIIVPLLVAPTIEEVVALVATVSFALAFALKDYVSSMIAGVVTILENSYQPGDWIEIDGAYGEVRAVGARAVHIVTADDTEVIIPHSKLWTSNVFNASGGKQSLLCVTPFYLKADHDGAMVIKAFTEIAETSGFRKAESAVKVVASETPWGTHYKVKAYVTESREQFAMITDLTIRGKDRLRTMGVAFAQAPYAEGKKD